MSFQGLLASVGTEVVWQIIGSGFALVTSLAAAVSLVQRRPTSPLSLVLGGVLGAVALLVLARIALLGWSADKEALRITLTTFSVLYLIGPLMLGPVIVTSLGACAFAGFSWPPGRPLLPVIALVGILVVVAVVVAGGFVVGNPLYALFRAFLYLVVGSLVAVAVSGGHTAAGNAACALFPLVVAAGEGSERGLVNLLLVAQAQTVPPEKWAEAAVKMALVVQPQWRASLVALAVASLVAAVGALAVSAGRRREAIGAVAIGVVVGWLLLLGSDLGAGRRQAMSLAVSGGASPSSPDSAGEPVVRPTSSVQ